MVAAMNWADLQKEHLNPNASIINHLLLFSTRLFRQKKWVFPYVRSLPLHDKEEEGKKLEC
jgi:hypothetical protein